MAGVADKVGQAGRRGADTIRQAKADYDAKGRFQKMRIQVVAAFVLNVGVTVAWVLAATVSTPPFVVRYQVGFPSNMVVVDTRATEALSDLTLVLDGLYSVDVAHLESGKRGFAIDREFRGADNAVPPADYQPRQLEIRVDGDVHVLPVVMPGASK